MLINEGNAYLKLHKNKEAIDAYNKAASMDPNPARVYFNLCATQYNIGNVEGAFMLATRPSPQILVRLTPTSSKAHYSLPTAKQIGMARSRLLRARSKLSANIWNSHPTAPMRTMCGRCSVI